eukprot:jgi/Psemu1/317152/fgenesh1_kg.5854_\
MSLNFLRIAAPVSTSHETYANLSQIKPIKKKRNRRSTCKDGVSTIALENKYQTTVVEGKYMETSWGGKIGGKKNHQPEQALSINNFETLDSTKDEHILAFDNSNPLLRIFAKQNRQLPEDRSVAVSTMIMLSLELDQKDCLPIMVCMYSKVM